MTNRDCKQLVQTLIFEDQLMIEMGMPYLPGNFIVQSFIDALDAMPELTPAQRNSILDQSADIAGGLLRVKMELEQEAAATAANEGAVG